jgi:16S rRNA (uracil1498-N3)-methyltransferase
VYLFYSKHVTDKTGQLLDEELHHCVTVLRKSVGDIIHITDGKGHIYEAKIVTAKKSLLEFAILNFTFTPKNKIQNAVAISPPKSGDRLDFFIEKAIETGLSHIYLFESKRTERSRVNMDRMQKIAMSAMKQSKQSYLTQIEILKGLDEVLMVTKDYQQAFIAHCNGAELPLSKVIDHAKSKIILIGPEGDFTEDEIESAIQSNLTPVSLGDTILRSETAGLYAAVLFSLKG